ncbi:MAG: DUF423 domain-containing protein [Tahibacter sp.]
MRMVGVAGAVAGTLAVGLGAFGAHALADVLDARGVELWRTATLYLFIHALVLLFITSLAQRGERRLLRVASGFCMVGILLFCGSLYALALNAPRWLGALTPLGGVALLLSWLSLAAAFHFAKTEPH